jgi:hypothetical protein
MVVPLSPTLVDFIRGCVPTFQAAEVLLFFASHPDRAFRVEEIVVEMRPAVITVPAVREYAALLKASGVISDVEGSLRYDPSAEVEGAVGELAHAYNERPVTLIRAIYEIADEKIKSFSDSFKLRKD